MWAGWPSPRSARSRPLSRSHGRGGHWRGVSMRDGHRGGPGGGDVSPTIRRRESSREIRERARQLRREATPSEERLWQALRDRRFRGLKFRRQRPAASFIPDFYCAELSLVVEVDGSIHKEPGVHARDLLRDEWLGRRRLRVLRISAA